jgi:hypothetical protein
MKPYKSSKVYKFLNDKNITRRKLITFIGLVVSVALMLLAYISHEHPFRQSVFVDSSVSIATIVITIALVENMLMRDNLDSMIDSSGLALGSLGTTIFIIIIQLARVYEIDWDPEKIKYGAEHLSSDEYLYNDVFSTLMGFSGSTNKKLNLDEFQEFKKTSQEAKQRIDEILNLYGESLDKKIIGKIHRVRADLEDLNFFFSLLPRDLSKESESITVAHALLSTLLNDMKQLIVLVNK